MRLLKSLLLASSCLLSSVSASDIAAAPDDDKSYDRAEGSIVEKYEMGFEVETSGIKVNHADEDVILVILESADKKWQLTTDTRDERIASAGWVNLECRTVGGLTQAEISQYIGLTQQIICRIKTLCDQTIDGMLEISKTNFLEKLNVSGEHIEGVVWGLEGKPDETLDKITFSTKRKVTKEISSLLKIITTIDELLTVYLFTNEDSSNEEKYGLKVELKDKEPLDSIEELKRKISHELLSRLYTSSEERIEFNYVDAMDIFSAILSEDRYKVALPQELAVTLSNSEGVFVSLDCTLKPQLTFSFPIKEISTVFMNVLNQEHASYVAPRICRIEKEINILQEKINDITSFLESSKDISIMSANRKAAEKAKLQKDCDALKEFQKLTVGLQSELFFSNTNLHGLCI